MRLFQVFFLFRPVRNTAVRIGGIVFEKTRKISEEREKALDNIIFI